MYTIVMKTRYKYGLTFLIVHILLSLCAILFVYEANVPNSDLGMIVFPNVAIPLVLTDNLPDIFGYWSNLYWGAVFWLFVGFIVGLLIEKRRLRKQARQ